MRRRNWKFGLLAWFNKAECNASYSLVLLVQTLWRSTHLLLTQTRINLPYCFNMCVYSFPTKKLLRWSWLGITALFGWKWNITINYSLYSFSQECFTSKYFCLLLQLCVVVFRDGHQIVLGIWCKYMFSLYDFMVDIIFQNILRI